MTIPSKFTVTVGRKIYKMRMRMVFICGVLVGIFLGLLLKRSIESLHPCSILLYDKTCGLRYWNSGQNFDNKDDIRFVSILKEFLVPVKGKTIVIDFGANIGQFSQALLTTPHDVPFIVHSIEPIITQYNSLKNLSRTFKKQKYDKHFLHNIAISDHSGKMSIYSKNEASEGATLGKGTKWNYTKVADVVVNTLPEFIKKFRIMTPTSFVKIDVEGFEPEVIRGMDLETNSDIFPVFSFETGGAWRDDRSVSAKNFTLKSFVTMLDRFGYDCFFIGYPYLLPLTGINWDDSFDGFLRAPNVLSVLRNSKPWKNLFMFIRHISFDSCNWQ